ncbi:MAG: hypothetical protein NVSMB45_02950 [Ginsengibacter sp.]
MKTNLEYFVREHRDQFDSEVPSTMILQNINTAKNKKRQIKITDFSIRQIAASTIIFLSGISIILLMQIKDPKLASHKINNTTTTAIDDEIINQNDIHKMIQIIQIKQTQLKEIETADPVLYKNFTADIKKLNTYYNNLQDEIKINPNKELLLEAMIQNLQLQQEVLNKQLQIIQNLKKTKNESHSKNI